MAETALYFSHLEGIPVLKRGKTRDVYDLGDHLLIVATDRISCFDVVLPTPVPGKGPVLTALSVFWFDQTKDIIDNHIVSASFDRFPRELKRHEALLTGRCILVRKAAPVRFECIVRGYLTGSGLKDYARTGSVCGVRLPRGLIEASKLPEPVFTPSTKAETGHDENVTQKQMEKVVGGELAGRLKEVSISLFNRAARHAEKRGLIIADSKFEFGIADGRLILIDELFTPDSSRFWPLAGYEPGKTQPSFDKQFVRDYLETLDWGKTYPGPELPEAIVGKTAEKYREALRMLTGEIP